MPAGLLLLFVLAGPVPGSGFRVPGLQAAVWHSALGTRNAVHDVHVSLTRIVLEGRTVACRIRLFRDDLQLTLQRYANQPGLRLTEEARADSLVSAYLGAGLRLVVNGQPVTLRVTGSGAERDQATQEVMWYVLEGDLKAPANTFVLLNRVMFEQFHDQQNIVQLLRLPEGRRQTFYFSASDPREQRLTF
jgi:Domain of unknown function (DUF6702)